MPIHPDLNRATTPYKNEAHFRNLPRDVSHSRKYYRYVLIESNSVCIMGISNFSFAYKLINYCRIRPNAKVLMITSATRFQRKSKHHYRIHNENLQKQQVFTSTWFILYQHKITKNRATLSDDVIVSHAIVKVFSPIFKLKTFTKVLQCKRFLLYGINLVVTITINKRLMIN